MPLPAPCPVVDVPVLLPPPSVTADPVSGSVFLLPHAASATNVATGTKAFNQLFMGSPQSLCKETVIPRILQTCGPARLTALGTAPRPAPPRRPPRTQSPAEFGHRSSPTRARRARWRRALRR